MLAQPVSAPMTSGAKNWNEPAWTYYDSTNPHATAVAFAASVPRTISSPRLGGREAVCLGGRPRQPAQRPPGGSAASAPQRARSHTGQVSTAGRAGWSAQRAGGTATILSPRSRGKPRPYDGVPIRVERDVVS